MGKNANTRVVKGTMIGLFRNNVWITFYELLREGVKIYDADWNIIERYISEIEKIWKIAEDWDLSIKLVFREYTYNRSIL